MKNNELRELMTEKNIKVDDIAKKLGVSRRTAQRRINGKVVRYVHEVFDLSDLLGIKPSEFVVNIMHMQ